MGRLERDGVARYTTFRNASRCQVLLDREVRKLHNWRTVHIHDSNQARARRQHHIPWVFRPPILLKRKSSFLPGFESKKFGKLFNTERTASNHDTLEEPMRIRPIV